MLSPVKHEQDLGWKHPPRKYDVLPGYALHLFLAKALWKEKKKKSLEIKFGAAVL